MCAIIGFRGNQRGNAFWGLVKPQDDITLHDFSRALWKLRCILVHDHFILIHARYSLSLLSLPLYSYIISKPDLMYIDCVFITIRRSTHYGIANQHMIIEQSLFQCCQLSRYIHWDTAVWLLGRWQYSPMSEPWHHSTDSMYGNITHDECPYKIKE